MQAAKAGCPAGRPAGFSAASPRHHRVFRGMNLGDVDQSTLGGQGGRHQAELTRRSWQDQAPPTNLPVRAEILLSLRLCPPRGWPTEARRGEYKALTRLLGAATGEGETSSAATRVLARAVSHGDLRELALPSSWACGTEAVGRSRPLCENKRRTGGPRGQEGGTAAERGSALWLQPGRGTGRRGQAGRPGTRAGGGARQKGGRAGLRVERILNMNR